MQIKNSKVLEIKSGLDKLRSLAPKAGLFGFKYATAVDAINPPAKRAIEALNETLAAHVLKDTVPNPKKPGESMEVWRKHPTVEGGFEVDDEYDKAAQEIRDAEVEFAVWPPVQFTLVDLEKAQVELPNELYVTLRDLLVFPSLK